MRAQISAELLIVLGFVIAVIIPIIIYFFSYYGLFFNSINSMKTVEWMIIVDNLIKNTLYSGNGSKFLEYQQINVEITNIENIEINKNTYVIYSLRTGEKIIFYYPFKVNVTAYKKYGGVKTIFENINGTVNVRIE